MSAHTPGFWEVDDDEGVVFATTHSGKYDKPIAEICSYGVPWSEEAAANALLIAAAPELLEVVRGVLGLERRKLLKDKGARAWIGAAEAVLAKVEGRR